MQTWLDRYIGQSSSLLQNIKEVDPQRFKGDTPKAIEYRKGLTDPGIAFRFFAFNAVRDLQERIEKGLPLYFDGMSDDFEVSLFNASLVPFVYPVDTAPNPVAFQLTAGLVEDLAGAEVTPEVFKLGVETAFHHRLFYFDIPQRTYTVKGLWLRGVVVDSSFKPVAGSTIEFGMKFYAILEEPGTGRHTRLSWILSRPEVVSSSESGLRERLGFTRSYQTANEGQMELLAEIETFILLAIAYGALERENEERAAEYLPRLEPGHERRQGRNARQVAKKFSLFSVAKLDNGGLHGVARVANDNRGTAESRRLHKVRGHFRLQPYGTGRSKRRLQWIAAFERGARSSVPVTKLHAIG